MKQVKKIGIVCDYPFPEGMAATTRIIAYSKGLVENSVDVEVFVYARKLDKEKTPKNGIIDGIKYSYPYIRRYNASLIRRIIIDKPRFIINFYRNIFISNKEQKFDYIFISTDIVKKLYSWVPVLKIMGFKLIFIIDEFPNPIRQLKTSIPSWMTLAYKLIHKCFIARVLMTNALNDYYNTILYKPSHVMCSVLDNNRFSSVIKDVNEDQYLCYMGNMQLAKDNVDNIIRAFSIIANKHKGLKLRLYGAPNNEDKNILTTLIGDLNLQNRVTLMGRVNYAEVPQILANAKVLVTSQPRTRRAEGGFPTKMAEYMMSGTPMIVTDVGEIKDYVQDSITAFMVKPCNPEEYASKIDYILNNPIEAEKVSIRAYNYAINSFGAKKVTAELLEFLSVL